jgi:hypothetical protein
MVAGCVFAVVILATVFCAAVNLYTFQIAYPLWRVVGTAEFAALHREYLRRLNWIITAPHVVMFFSAGALIAWHPAFVSRVSAIVLFALDAAVVAVSAFAAGPTHDRFARTGVADAEGLRRLIRISALRSGLMLCACGLIGWWLVRASLYWGHGS